MAQQGGASSVPGWDPIYDRAKRVKNWGGKAFAGMPHWAQEGIAADLGFMNTAGKGAAPSFKFGPKVWYDASKNASEAAITKAMAPWANKVPGMSASEAFNTLASPQTKASMNRLGNIAGKRAFGKSIGGVGGAFSKALGPAMTGYFMYEGYKEGGMIGALKGGAESIGYTLAFKAAGALLKPLLPIAIAAAVGYGAYRFGEAATRHSKSLSRLEMGSEVIDRFGNLATTRQRSLQALQNTHLNGRMALGNEAAVLHRALY